MTMLKRNIYNENLVLCGVHFIDYHYHARLYGRVIVQSQMMKQNRVSCFANFCWSEIIVFANSTDTIIGRCQFKACWLMTYLAFISDSGRNEVSFVSKTA
ncbi:hypothetical protein TNCT_252931 [Trichonephila clavata]|uniref:Uncharacterized protein n=1 Tax=Trichonephila clavata TaxID=2740835 RepID=A0A8X6HAM7_TRICU|nr:hypothetical protein TNCT_252931 [Trichonephila clavata]